MIACSYHIQDVRLQPHVALIRDTIFWGKKDYMIAAGCLECAGPTDGTCDLERHVPSTGWVGKHPNDYSLSLQAKQHRWQGWVITPTWQACQDACWHGLLIADASNRQAHSLLSGLRIRINLS